jgi:hypothetical protein
MRILRFLTIFILLFISIKSLGQIINKRLSIISDCDTSFLSTYIGEIYYFGKNIKKAQYFPQLSCIRSEKNYQILWVPSRNYNKRTKVSKSQLNQYVYESKDNGFEKFSCYAFIINLNVTRYDNGRSVVYEPKFPSVVEVYQLTNNEWIKLFEEEVKSHAELGEVQLKTIYK